MDRLHHTQSRHQMNTYLYVNISEGCICTAKVTKNICYTCGLSVLKNKEDVLS